MIPTTPTLLALSQDEDRSDFRRRGTWLAYDWMGFAEAGLEAATAASP